MSQFNYCPLVWMCHSRGLNNKINNIHKRPLRIGQNSRYDNLCKSDVQLNIYLKLMLIKLNPVVFLLIAKGYLVCNFKSSVGEILVSFYLFIINTCLKGHSCLKYIRCLAPLGTICKKREKARGGMSLLVKLQAYFTKSNTPPWVFSCIS